MSLRLATQTCYVVDHLPARQTLRDLLEELERVPEELCRHVGYEMAKGLAAIHEAGVVHRDIKPENYVIETYEGQVLVWSHGPDGAPDSEDDISYPPGR